MDLRLSRVHARGLTWNPILHWTLHQVLTEINQSAIRLHDAYTLYGSTRVRCAFCIMSSAHDLAAAASCEENHAVLTSIVELEAKSTFAFQGGRWLADTAPHLLTAQLKNRIERAKHLAAARQTIEARIPPQLLYTKGWPTALPTLPEAELLAEVRRRLSDLLSLNAGYLTGPAVRSRYAALLEAKEQKNRTA